MKRTITIIASFLIGSSSFSQNDVQASASDNWIGWMNVSYNNGPGGSPSSYWFGSQWGVGDLATLLDVPGNTISLYPNWNTYDPADTAWWDSGNNQGNKYLEASTYAEPMGFNGQDLTFSGYVVSNNLDASYDAKFFIKALDPNDNYNDALGGTKVMDLPASGSFTVSATGAELQSGLIVQYGFAIMGRNGNPNDSTALGKVVIGADPSAGLSEMGLLQSGVYPNPASTDLNIKGEFDSYQIIDLTGKSVEEGEIFNGSVNIKGIENGNYMIRLVKGEEVIIEKFIKK